MRVFALILFILGLTLTQSSPVAKKVEKRTAIESTKADISPKLFNPKDDPESFKPRVLQFDDPKTKINKDGQKDEKIQDSKDLKKEEKKDDLRPEDDSESLDVDREKKSCKTVKTAPPPPTKICLEISNSPTQVEVCEDDPPPRPETRPQEPPQINVETQPSFEYPVFQVPHFHIEEPQTIYVPPPPPPQPSTICFETYPQPQISELPVFPVPQPQFSPTSVVPGSPQFVPSTVIQVQPQPQFGNPQTLQEWLQYHKQLHKLHFHLPHQLHNIIHGTQPTFNRPPPQYLVPGGMQFYPTQSNGHITTCSCKVGGSPNGLVFPGGNQGSTSLPGNIVVKPVGPTGPGTITVTGNGQTRKSGGIMFDGPIVSKNQPMMNQPMMMHQPMMMSSPISGPARAMDVSWSPMMVQGHRFTRGETGSSLHEHALETEQNSHPQSSEKEEQSTQISLNPSSSSPILRISNPHQSSQMIYSPNSLMTDKNNLNEDNMNLRNIEIQGQGMQPFLLGRSRQHLKEENLATNARYEGLDGM